MAESGVSSAGLMTTVLPAAKAGAMFQPIKRMGKFQGKMNPHGPQGWRTVQASCPLIGQGVAALDVNRHVDVITHRVDEVLHVALGLGSTLPASSDSIWAMIAFRFSTASVKRCSSTPRSLGESRAHGDFSKAAAAAWTAASMSADSMAGNSASGCREPGSQVTIRSPLAASTSLPPTTALRGLARRNSPTSGRQSSTKGMDMILLLPSRIVAASRSIVNRRRGKNRRQALLTHHWPYWANTASRSTIAASFFCCWSASFEPFATWSSHDRSPTNLGTDPATDATTRSTDDSCKPTAGRWPRLAVCGAGAVPTAVLTGAMAPAAVAAGKSRFGEP